MMGRSRKVQICRVLIVLCLCFIWGNSFLPAQQSQALSQWVKSIPDVFLMESETAAGMGDAVVRKLAHFTEFGVLGFLLSRLRQLQNKSWGCVLFLGTAAACVDETIQIFIPGRGPGILDVGIDTCGVLAGMVLLWIGHRFIRKLQQT